MKVIITRPSPDAEAFAAEIARLGAVPVVSPVMAIRQRDRAIDLNGVGALAFTSANGVRAFSALSAERGPPVFAVGEITARAASAAGFSSVTAASGDVETLARLVSSAKPSSPVLHLAGSERAGDLLALLRKEGVAARRAVIYDAVKTANLTVEARAALTQEPENVAVVFFSPRSARLFLEQASAAGVASRLEKATALCLSEEVRSAAGAAGWASVEIAATRSADGMALLVAAWLAGRKSRNGAEREPSR